jgi:hypothetical protein
VRLRVYVEFTIEGADAQELRDRAEAIGDELALPPDAADFEAVADDRFESEDPDEERSNGPASRGRV